MSRLGLVKSLSMSGALALLAAPVVAATDFSYSGKISLESRYFFEDAAYPDQAEGAMLSLAVEPDLLWQFESGNDIISFKPFFRADPSDSERHHGDIRELVWEHYGDDWELRTGIGKAYWGVAEFQHLVDVINQDDGVEDIGSEDKLGQPMINLSLVRDWGIVDLFVLPGFRERTYAGRDGRLRPGLLVDTDNALYEDDDEEKHIDFAARWSHSIGDYDIGVHAFDGTNRTPSFVPTQTAAGETVLQPYYEQMTQYGIDVQATIESWLWKGEMIHRDTENDSYIATQTGAEYTLYGINDSDADLGMLLEYGWDERGEDATSVGQNDISVGARIAMNDTESTEFLGGVIYDLDYNSVTFQVEASRRFGEQFKLALDVRVLTADDPNDPLSALEKDSHAQLNIEWFF